MLGAVVVAEALGDFISTLVAKQRLRLESKKTRKANLTKKPFFFRKVYFLSTPVSYNHLKRFTLS